jgi:predicted nucleotidyltransferase
MAVESGRKGIYRPNLASPTHLSLVDKQHQTRHDSHHKTFCVSEVKRMTKTDPFPTVRQLERECRGRWNAYRLAADQTAKMERRIRKALKSAHQQARFLDVDSCLVLFGSFARYEIDKGSDLDWAILVDGVVNASHSEQTRATARALSDAEIVPPGTSGIFGGMVFSHDLVHFIGGTRDSNENLTRRVLMLLESRFVKGLPGSISERIWENVVKNILKRYFEEDVHFRPGQHRVPRFLLNDITRYWRTICVDYAAKHREQDGKKWALRNAKIRLSRKLLFAAGIAFCFDCQLSPLANRGTRGVPSAQAFIQSALQFAKTPPLEYLAQFVMAHIKNLEKRQRICRNIFGAYNRWLLLIGDGKVRRTLARLSHSEAATNLEFQKVRNIGSEFASGLRELFFNRSKEEDKIAQLSLEYVGF